MRRATPRFTVEQAGSRWYLVDQKTGRTVGDWRHEPTTADVARAVKLYERARHPRPK